MTDTDQNTADDTTDHDESTAGTSPVSEAENAGEPASGAQSDGGTADAAPTAPAVDQSEDSTGGKLVAFVEWAAFAILCLLALVATFRFYFSASEAIRIWFSPDFVPIFQATFNLLILVASAFGISVLVRRLR